MLWLEAKNQGVAPPIFFMELVQHLQFLII